MGSVELFDHLEIPRGNIVRKIDSVYIFLYEDNFSQIPLCTFISSHPREELPVGAASLALTHSAQREAA